MTSVTVVHAPGALTVDWAAPIALGAAGVLLLCCLWPTIRETTLSAAWWWALAALIAIAGADALAGLIPPDRRGESLWIDPLRFAAAASAFCPLMAQLGAKRPQHRAWGFVVLSLWGIVALPALESLALRKGEMTAVTDLRSLFLGALIAVGVANMLPTRYWWSALLAGAAQACFLAEHLPLLSSAAGDRSFLLGLGLGVASLACAVFVARRRPRNVPPWDAIWLDFRDNFGALWALRVAERVNADAVAQNWEFSLTWSGFRRRGNKPSKLPLSAAEHERLQRTMNNLLRRFVSPQWIAARLGESVN